MGVGRNLRELIDQYQLRATRIKGFKPPTLSYATIKGWASTFDWSNRATEYDANFEALKNEERQKVFANELVNDFGRVRKLVELAEFLESQLFEQDENGNFHNVWNPDVKGVGQGLEAMIVDIEKFNPAIIEQYRATLADIAKEVGGRVTKTEVAGNGGGAIETRNTNVVINAENAHDAGNILKQLAELGAIPPARGEGGHDPTTE